MKDQKLFFSLLLCFIFVAVGIELAQGSSSHGVKKLFVFGDSYADTGNDLNPRGRSWMEPYGITYPGKPAGRFSDGLLFTDFLAIMLRLKSPVPYKFRNVKGGHLRRYGMNFAYGGTGVFDTSAPYPNMTTQIDMFQKLLNNSIFTTYDLRHSVVHVSAVGNDYSNYLATGGSIEGLQAFIAKVINQLTINLERIHKLGAKKITVVALQPLGCLPQNTLPTSYQKCNEIFNSATKFHNLLLQNAIAKLNNQTSNCTSSSSPFVTIDFYTAFSSIITPNTSSHGNSIFKDPLRPCCKGINSTYFCGSVDAKGNKMYSVCDTPKKYFFWDGLHPTQAGWRAVIYSLKSTIRQLHY